MNLFVLNAGRCGSTTFIRACGHIRNFSCGHETRLLRLGADRIDYPPRHIEADNRLSWFLGRLDQRYGDQAWYVHLQREAAGSVASFARREGFGIMQAYREGILLGADGASAEALADDYLHTVEANIRCFLKDKTRVMDFALEQAERDFQRFWHWIGAEGDLPQALAEWQVRYNASNSMV